VEEIGGMLAGLLNSKANRLSQIALLLSDLLGHYRALVRDADVTRYWSVAPGNVEEEIASTPTPPA
jgi:hypothetical protein